MGVHGFVETVKAGGITVEITGGNHVRVITNNGHREILACSPRNPRSCLKSFRRIRENTIKE